ncbi:MAG: NYN domain-containing protein [Nitrospinae bacterium]|nr:NYN domain-containing protein [Nitrospinota bacterium]
MDKVAVFADVQNIYYTVKQRYHCHFDYGAFWEHATPGRSLVKAIAYATDKGDRKQIDFQQILGRIGFEIKLTPFLQRRDGSAKGDWDVGIALDMIEYAKRVDTIVLASGDGDYTVVVDKIRQEHNVSVEIYGVADLTASSLIESATRFVPIQGNMLLSIPTTWGPIRRT